MSWAGLVFWAGSLCQDRATTFRFFIKSPEEGRLVRPKYRETSSRSSLCCFVIYVYLFAFSLIPDLCRKDQIDSASWVVCTWPHFESEGL